MHSLEQTFSKAKNSFSANHFLIGFGKCERLHGHNYMLKVTIKYIENNNIKPINFKIINSVIQNELMALNQKILIPKNSSKFNIQSTLKGKNWKVKIADKEYMFPKQDVVLLDGIDQTTTEELARYLHQKFSFFIKKNFPKVIKFLCVNLSETMGNQAHYCAPIT